MSTGTRLAVEPFEFYTLAHVTRSRGQNAHNASELLAALQRCSDESIYHHTIAALRNQYATSEKMLNDYARWAYSELNRPDLGDQLASLDNQEFQTIEELRRAACEVLSEFERADPGAASAPAGKAFSICEGMEVRVPVDAVARDLSELRKCIAGMSGESFYLHFVASRLSEVRSNDFSLWLRRSLRLDELAAKIEEIDVMESTLEAAREKVLALIDEEAADATPGTRAE